MSRNININIDVIDPDTQRLMQIVELLLARLGGSTVITDAEIEALATKSELMIDTIEGGVLVRSEVILDG